MTYTASARTFYVNGVAAGSGSSASINPDNGGGAIGDVANDPYPGAKFPGMIDEVGLYNRVLAQSEVAAIYAAGPLGKGSAP